MSLLLLSFVASIIGSAGLSGRWIFSGSIDRPIEFSRIWRLRGDGKSSEFLFEPGGVLTVASPQVLARLAASMDNGL